MHQMHHIDAVIALLWVSRSQDRIVALWYKTVLSDYDDDFAQRNYPSLLIVVQWKDAGWASLQGKKEIIDQEALRQVRKD